MVLRVNLHVFLVDLIDLVGRHLSRIEEADTLGALDRLTDVNFLAR